MTKTIRCRDIERLILNGEDMPLKAETERFVEDHLAVCPRCRDFSAARALMRRELSATDWPSLPAELDRRIRRLRGEMPGRRRAEEARARLPLPWPVMAAAAVLIALLGTWTSVALAEIGPDWTPETLPPAARTALLFIAQNAIVLFFTPLILRAVRPHSRRLT